MIPDYQSMMLPFLKLINDGGVHTTTEILPQLATQFHLSEEQLNELTLTKKHKVFANRVHWVKAQLKTYGLIDLLYRHTFQISERGKLILQEDPAAISNQYLKEDLKH